MPKKNILITGGAGFIGSHVVRLFVQSFPEETIFNLDKLSYAGNLENLVDIEESPNYKFMKGDIEDASFISEVFDHQNITHVIHLAAESHVDRSISDPTAFAKTNVIGTVNLLNAAVANWKPENPENLFYHISTDEVFGSLGEEGLFTESTPYDPKSPYSSSKAASDHFVRAYHNTYKLQTVISNCSNNYGPNQFPEKLIPLMISNIKENKPLPVYGQGANVRDWLYVEDHAEAIKCIFESGSVGETYNIGGWNEWRNIEIVKLICSKMDSKLGRGTGESEKLINFVTDRPGHDMRYAIDATKIRNELGWKPSKTFEQGIELTIDWYLKNESWLEHVTSGEYQKYYQAQYQNR